MDAGRGGAPMTARAWLDAMRRRGHLLGPLLGLTATLVLVLFLAGVLPIVRFVRERIDIAIYPKEVRVEGLYVYQNPWPFPVIQGFSIPLPVDATHPMQNELAAMRLAPDAGPIPLRNILGQNGFDLRFRPHEEVQVAVRYRQLVSTKDARYLLTTTRPWRRPLEHAVYTLTPHGVALTGSNYALRSNGQGLLVFERTDFMPPDDWRFSWEVQPK